jgi:hypothetical protein
LKRLVSSCSHGFSPVVVRRVAASARTCVANVSTESCKVSENVVTTIGYFIEPAMTVTHRVAQNANGAVVWCVDKLSDSLLSVLDVVGK